MHDDAARWRRLESIVHAALARPQAERSAFLAEACSGDGVLQRDAQWLIQEEGRAEAFLSGTPLEALAARAMGSSAGVALAPGETILHYRMTHAIGSGGMGQVYAAHDTRLDREVALKILPPELAGDRERRTRFTREAKAIAALNHPNIVTVYAVEEAGDRHFITMELVRGRTLAELLPQNGFALGKFLEIAIPLTDALAAAHQAGITHRDVKPANVMVTDNGRVKVLDFGLAKTRPDAPGGETPTISLLTEIGHVAGTPAYMSPEQAEGKTVDARSDLFSLGIVFYEMLTAQRPFVGDSTTAILSSILSATPRPLVDLKPDAPRRLAGLVHRCLEKNLLDRYQSAIDLRHDLEDIRRDTQSDDAALAAPARLGSRRGFRLAWALGGAVALAGTGSLWLLGSGPVEEPSTVPRFQNTVQVTSSPSLDSYPTWSPDGQRVAYQSSDLGHQTENEFDIWVAQVGSGEPINLTKNSGVDDRRPSWSPDGREIAFFSNRDGGWGVYAMPAIGGSARKLLTLPASFTPASSNTPRWSRDGTTLFVAANEGTRNFVITVSLGSLDSTRVMLPQHESPRCWDLDVRPDGGRFAYLEAGGGNPEVSRLWTIAASGGEGISLTDGRSMVWSPTWSADGTKIFYVSNRGGTMDLWQQEVAGDGRPVGEPIVITQGVGMTSAVFSPDGTRLAYARGGTFSSVWRVPILSDRAARWSDATRLTSERAFIEFIDVSPDGKQLAVSSNRRGNRDLWVLPVAGGEMTPLTTDPTPDWNPRWSPDGREMLFYALRSGNRDIWVMPAGGGQARQLTSQPEIEWYATWSPDGRDIAYQKQTAGSGSEIWIVKAMGGQPRLMSEAVQQGGQPAWSPDGEWLVFRDGRSLVRVNSSGGPRLPLTIPPTHSPNVPRFSADGQSIYYSINSGAREDHGIWSVSLRDGRLRQLTKLEGVRGSFGYYFTADSRDLYIIWRETEGDIWVMDVAADAAR